MFERTCVRECSASGTSERERLTGSSTASSAVVPASVVVGEPCRTAPTATRTRVRRPCAGAGTVTSSARQVNVRSGIIRRSGTRSGGGRCVIAACVAAPHARTQNTANLSAGRAILGCHDDLTNCSPEPRPWQGLRSAGRSRTNHLRGDSAPVVRQRAARTGIPTRGGIPRCDCKTPARGQWRVPAPGGRPFRTSYSTGRRSVRPRGLASARAGRSTSGKLPRARAATSNRREEAIDALERRA